MADTENHLTCGGVVDPAREDWQTKEDAELYHAAQAGVPQAKDEMTRRNGHRQRIAQTVKAYRKRFTT